MYRKDNKSKIITSLVLVLVLTLSIGFAAFSNTLRITPQATITPDSATFDIDFSKISTGVDGSDITPTLTGTGITAEDAEIDNSTSPTITNLSVDFTEPGQKAVYSFYAYNNGEYLAYLNSINFLNAEGANDFISCVADNDDTHYVDEACEGIKVSIRVGTLETDETIENITGHTLAKQRAEEIVVTIEYESGSARADGPFSIDIGDITLVYTTLDSEGGNVVNTKACTYDGDLVQGAEFVDGQYTYRYMQEFTYMGEYWGNIDREGWGVLLTDRESTNPVTTTLCTTINDKPIVSTDSMFYNSKATSIDVSSFDTSQVYNMEAMFFYTSAQTITGLTNFNTNNVIYMQYMFSGTNTTELDISKFNTNNVTMMYNMFASTQATTITGLTSFDISNVINMSSMFADSQVSEIDLSSFDTTEATEMSDMFKGAKATVGYAKTEADAVRFNNTSNKPAALTFQVK